MNIRTAATAFTLALTMGLTGCYAASDEPTDRQSRREARQAQAEREERLRDYATRAGEEAGKLASKANEWAAGASEYLEDLEEPATAPGGAYDRDAFGPDWYDEDQNGCDARNDILARDLTDVVMDSDSCTVRAGTLDDRYTGKPIRYEYGGGEVHVDHIVPLSAAWHMGADGWSEAKRVEFANDPQNLESAYSGANMAKGDSTLSEWMPVNDEFHCAYASQFVAVAVKYDLKVSPADEAVAARAC